MGGQRSTRPTERGKPMATLADPEEGPDVRNIVDDLLCGDIDKSSAEGRSDWHAAAEALACFEADAKLRDFQLFHYQHAIAFKRHLAERQSPTTGRPLSKATLAHVKRFFEWLPVSRSTNRGLATPMPSRPGRAPIEIAQGFGPPADTTAGCGVCRNHM